MDAGKARQRNKTRSAHRRLARIFLLLLPCITIPWCLYITISNKKYVPVTINNIGYNNADGSNRHKLTIVTGASSSHWPHLVQFVTSFEKYYINDTFTSLIIYDLGLNSLQLNRLKNHKVLVESFDYNKYPNHVNLHDIDRRKIYAWKPIIVDKVCREYGGIIIWMDATNSIIGKLNGIYSRVQSNGIYIPLSDGKIRKYTHAKTVKYLKYTGDLNQRNIAANLVGFNYDIVWTQHLINNWKACALVVECIAPHGSNRNNHKHDQAVLTILYYQYHTEYRFNIADQEATHKVPLLNVTFGDGLINKGLLSQF